jgi:hypothetical protein
MTSEQKVKTVYPDAVCITSMLSPRPSTYSVYDQMGLGRVLLGQSARKSWAWAAAARAVSFDVKKGPR